MSLFSFLPPLMKKILPRSLIAALRRQPLARKLARSSLSGVHTRPFPDSSYTIHFDGYRNIGYLAKDLSKLELRARTLIRRYLDDHKPPVIWDVGANIGYWSLYFSATCPWMRELRCFEPDSVNLRYLKLNRNNNHLPWLIREMGLSDQPATLEFHSDPETGATGSLESQHEFIEKHYGAKTVATRIQVTTIDDEVAAGAQVPGFLKIDVEGHELTVLKGGRHTLGRHRPMMIIEVTANHEAVAQLLGELGYRMLNMDGQVLTRPEFLTFAAPAQRD